MLRALLVFAVLAAPTAWADFAIPDDLAERLAAFKVAGATVVLVDGGAHCCHGCLWGGQHR